MVTRLIAEWSYRTSSLLDRIRSLSRAGEFNSCQHDNGYVMMVCLTRCSCIRPNYLPAGAQVEWSWTEVLDYPGRYIWHSLKGHELATDMSTQERNCIPTACYKVVLINIAKSDLNYIQLNYKSYRFFHVEHHSTVERFDLHIIRAQS